MKTLKRSLAIVIVSLMLLTALPINAFAYEHQSHVDLALEAVHEGIVLLKNENNALPLAKGEKIALFGEGQIFTGMYESGYRIGGGGSGWVYINGEHQGPLDAFRAAEAAGKVDLYDELSSAYENSVSADKKKISYVPNDTMYNNAAAKADTAIMIITRFSKENADMTVSEWYLTDAEKAMMKKLDSKFDKLIVILNTPGIIGTEWSLPGNTDGITVDALITCYMGGERGAEGLVDIMTGAANPSGKLTDTYAKDIYDYPTTATFLENDYYVNYTEDIYMGYRYFETFAKDKVAYPFGFGLSYTDFDITTNSVTFDKQNVNVEVTVKNTGKVAGKEVVQVYYSAPQAGVGNAVLSKSAIVLANYQKTKLLAPNESQTLTISYPISDMASYDDMGATGASNKACYVLEPGDYKILVGNSVRAASSKGTYTVDSLRITERLSNKLDTNLTERMNASGGYEALVSKGVTVVSDAAPVWIEAETGEFDIGVNANNRETCSPSSGYIYNDDHSSHKAWVNTGSATVLGALDKATAGGEIRYKLNVTKAGTYNLGFIIANGLSATGNPDGDNVLDVYVNGEKQSTSIDAPNTRNVGTSNVWFNFKFTKADLSGTPYAVNLPAGEVTLSFKVTAAAKNARANIDRFVILPTGMSYTASDAIAATKTFKVSSSELTWIEGEYGSIAPGSQIRRFEQSGSNGYIYNGSAWAKISSTRMLGNMDKATVGESIEYTLNVAKAGTYNLGFIMANGFSASGDPAGNNILDVYVNGEKQSISIDSPNTRNMGTGYAWFNLRYENADLDNKAYSVNLPAGEVTLSFKITSTIKNARTNIDRFVIIPDGATCSVTDAINYHNGNTHIDVNKDSFIGITYADVESGKATLEQLIDQMSYAELIDLCSGHTGGLTNGTGTIGFSANATAQKYGIYAADTADGPAGLRLGTSAVVATFWPCATLQACTWNTELLEKIGTAIGEEALKYNVDIWLAPGLNLHRNPLCGRNFEYYSEDPLISGKSAAAVVKGAQSQGISCCIKHFAANGKETNRKKSDSRISEKALRELYLKGFEIAVKESSPSCLMTSYNLINGAFTSANGDLINGILREEWGYEGLVMSDWNTTPLITDEILAGNNVTMPQGEPDQLKEAVYAGVLKRDTLEQNAYYIIKTITSLPDHTVHAKNIKELSVSEKTKIYASDFTNRAYMTQLQISDGHLALIYTEKTDPVDGSHGFIEFTVLPKFTSSYKLSMEYACTSTISNAFKIYLNGDEVNVSSRTPSSTGSFNNYQSKDLGEITLTADQPAVIRIQHMSSVAVNYRSISLEHTHVDTDEAWSNDNTHHWHSCACGEDFDRSAHADENTDRICDQCGYEIPTTPNTPDISDKPNTPDTPDDPGNPDDTNDTDTADTIDTSDSTDTAETTDNSDASDDSDSDKSGIGTGAVIAVIIGAIAIVGIGGFSIFRFVIKKKAK